MRASAERMIDLGCRFMTSIAGAFSILFSATLEPRSGHLFLFCNQSRNRLKILFWDGNGLWVCAKRLERGRFSWPQVETQGDRVRLTHEELTFLLGGIDLERTRAKNWHRYEEKTYKKLVIDTGI